MIFDLLSINFDFGPAGTRPVQIMPRLMVSVYDKEEYKQVTFVRTRLYEGEIKLGGERIPGAAGERLPSFAAASITQAQPCCLSPKEGGSRIDWWGGDRLMAVHKVDGPLLHLLRQPDRRATDRPPVSGRPGHIRDRAGWTGDNQSERGRLAGGQGAGCAGRGRPRWTARPSPRAAASFRWAITCPITSLFSSAACASSISHNYHSDGKPRDRGGRARVYGMTVRKDQPYVLDFSNKPDVMFASPARDQRFKPGDTHRGQGRAGGPEARLHDPRPGGHHPREGQCRKPLERYLSLDPKVLITRANGEKVAEGVMPFG